MMMSAFGVYTGSRVDTHAGLSGVEISDSPSRRVHPGDGVHVAQEPGSGSGRAGRGTEAQGQTESSGSQTPTQQVRAALSGLAKITSQIRCDGVVPSR